MILAFPEIYECRPPLGICVGTPCYHTAYWHFEVNLHVDKDIPQVCREIRMVGALRNLPHNVVNLRFIESCSCHGDMGGVTKLYHMLAVQPVIQDGKEMVRLNVCS